MNQYLELGQIVNVRGLKGEVKVNSFAENNSRFETLSEIFLKAKGNMQKYKIQKVSYSKNQVILKFEGIDTVEEAEKLRNSYILVDRNNLEELPKGVYYLAATSINFLTVSVGFAPFLIHSATFSLSNTIVAGSVIGLYVPIFSIILPSLGHLESATTT